MVLYRIDQHFLDLRLPWKDDLLLKPPKQSRDLELGQSICIVDATPEKSDPALF